MYFSVDDKLRNGTLKLEIEKIIESNAQHPLLTIGDLNGHVGFKGTQKPHGNERMILEWMEKYKMIMLTEGKFTRATDTMH